MHYSIIRRISKPAVCVGVNLATICGYSVPDLFEGESYDNSYLLPKFDNKEHDWQLVDIYYGRQNVPKGESFALYFDRPSESLVEVPLDDPLTELAHKALARAPKWLYDDLYTNFSKMFDYETQDKFAQIILSTTPPYVDEVAFQVASINPYILGSIDPELLEVNAKLLYILMIIS
ncbi:MAG: hypothetical protein ACUVWP_05215 [bacterium]